MAARIGLDFPENIDLMVSDPRTGEIILIIVAPEQWADAEGQELPRLQDKVNHYAEFVGEAGYGSPSRYGGADPRSSRVRPSRGRGAWPARHFDGIRGGRGMNQRTRLSGVAKQL